MLPTLKKQIKNLLEEVCLQASVDTF